MRSKHSARHPDVERMGGFNDVRDAVGASAAAYRCLGTTFTEVERIQCSPPMSAWWVEGAAGSPVPCYDSNYYAFIGKVVAQHSGREHGPSLTLEVIDAWTNLQSVGSLVTASVTQWQGCGSPKPMGEPFLPKKYPIGTRVRFVARSLSIHAWDVDVSLSVAGAAL